MMTALKTAWQILWHIPVGALWVGMYFILWIGWGLKSADLFIKHWNNFIDEDCARHDTAAPL